MKIADARLQSTPGPPPAAEEPWVHNMLCAAAGPGAAADCSHGCGAGPSKTGRRGTRGTGYTPRASCPERGRGKRGYRVHSPSAPVVSNATRPARHARGERSRRPCRGESHSGALGSTGCAARPALPGGRFTPGYNPSPPPGRSSLGALFRGCGPQSGGAMRRGGTVCTPRLWISHMIRVRRGRPPSPRGSCRLANAATMSQAPEPECLPRRPAFLA